MSCLYRKKVFSTRAWRWCRVSFFHFLRPTLVLPPFSVGTSIVSRSIVEEVIRPRVGEALLLRVLMGLFLVLRIDIHLSAYHRNNIH